MRSFKQKGKHYLQCANRHISRDACVGAFISVDRLEGLVLGELRRLCEVCLDKDELAQSIEFSDSLSESGNG